MIDPTKFATWMAALSDRFNRPLLPGTQRAYFEALSCELTTEEFERAAAMAFRDETFWPSPRAIIEKVHPPADPKVRATEAFEDLKRAIARLGWQEVDRQVVPALSAPLRRALEGVGGVYAVAMASYTDLPHIARRFAEVYEHACVETAVALPRASEAVRLTGTRPKLLTE